MKFPYEEFDLVRRPDLSARLAQEQGDAADFAQAVTCQERRRGAAGVAARHPRRRRFQGGGRGACARRARRERGIIWGLGAHVIKTGLSPVLIDLMERGFVSALATNGAGIIHDFELALSGATSEDVDEALGPGRFGMAEETGTHAERRDQRGRRRAGSASARRSAACLRAMRPAARRRSASLAAAARLEIPLTVHVAIGTDIIHMHPDASGAALGEGSLRDFRYFVSNVARLERRRLPELRIGGGAARGVPEGGGAGAQPRRRRSTG